MTIFQVPGNVTFSGTNITIGQSAAVSGTGGGVVSGFSGIAIGNHDLILDDEAFLGPGGDFRTVSIGHNSSSFSGRSNTLIGSQSTITGSANNVLVGCAGTVTQSQSVGIGVQCSINASNSIAVGFGSVVNNSADNSVAIGYNGTVSSYASNGVAIGASSSIAASATNCISIGQGASVTSDKSILIGAGTSNAGSGYIGNIVLGYQAQSTASAQFVIGSDGAEIDFMYIGRGVRSGTTGSGTLISATTGSGYNITATDLLVAGGASTGTGESGSVRLQTAFASTASSNTLNTLVDRFFVNSVQRALSSGTPTTFFRMAVPNLKAAGGTVHYTIFATDGTNVQSLSGSVRFAAVAKAGAITFSVTDDAAIGAGDTAAATAVTSGTLTSVWQGVDLGSNLFGVNVTATTSLTTTIFNITYTIINNSNSAITIL